MKRTLIVDCQVFQTDAWNRGMGKYSLELLQALVNNSDFNYQVILCFSANLPLTEVVDNTLASLFPTAKRQTLNLLTTDQVDLAACRTHNMSELKNGFGEALLLNSDFLILALFIDMACPVFPEYCRRLLLFYDIIPHLYSERYLPVESSREKYYRHYETVFLADCIFAISETVKSDLELYLGIPARKVITIDGGAIDRTGLTAARVSNDKSKPYILMPSGDDLRKNNLVAVRGFAEFNRRNKNKYKLLITSTFSPAAKGLLNEASKDIVFTGNVSEAEIKGLYEQASAVLFATEYEGLGLPILEAVNEDKPVACSDIPVFREISETALYMFDPHDPLALAAALQEAIDGVDWADKRSHYASIIEHYTWPQTARRFMHGLLGQKVLKVAKGKRPRLAIFSPDPAGYSAIGKVVCEMHPSLIERFEVDYYFDRGVTGRVVRPNYLQYAAPSFDADTFTAWHYQTYDAVIYHVGNSEYHIHTIRTALCYPGYLISHDTSLKEIFELMAGRGYITSERYALEEKLNVVFGTTTTAFMASLCNAQLGIIAHSEYAATALGSLVGNRALVKKINLATPTPTTQYRPNNNRLKIGFAGIMTNNKGLSTLQSLSSQPSLQQADFHIFGYKVSDVSALNSLETLPNVHLESNLSDFNYQSRLSSLDILVCYRESYRGETSLTVLEAMRSGVTVVVRDVGWFSELPDDAVIKVSNEDELTATIARLAAFPKELTALGARSAAIMRQDYNEQQYVDKLQVLIAKGQATELTNLEVAHLLQQAEPYQALRIKLAKLLDNKPKEKRH